MITTYLIRVEFETSAPFMYSFCGALRSDAYESATNFMKFAAIRRPIRAEIWHMNDLVLTTVITYEG